VALVHEVTLPQGLHRRRAAIQLTIS